MGKSSYHFWNRIKTSAPAYGDHGSFICVDTETTGVDLRKGARPFAVSLCDHTGATSFFRWKVNPVTYQVDVNPSDLDFLQEAIGKYGRIVFHHGKFDIYALETVGLYLTDLPDFWERYRDTLLYSHVLNSYESHGLKDLADRYLDKKLKLGSEDEKALRDAVVKARRLVANAVVRPVGSDYWRAGAELEQYAVNDVKRTAILYAMFCVIAHDENLLEQVAREHFLTPIVYRMEERGIRFRTSTYRKQREGFQAVVDSQLRKLKSQSLKLGFSDFNPASSKQLTELLYEKLRLPVLSHTRKGSPSTDVATLNALVEEVEDNPKRYGTKATEIIDSLKQYRKAGRGITYGDRYYSLSLQEKGPGDGKRYRVMRTRYNQTGTDTTRFSSDAIQNVSTKEELPLRENFGPRPGHFWVDCDFSNIELRIPAYLSGDKKLIRGFERGISFHLVVCEELHGPKEHWPNLNRKAWDKSPEYKSTKNGDFAILFGGGRSRVDATYGIPGAYDLIAEKFAKLVNLTKEVIAEGKKTGYVTTLFGYRLYNDPLRPYAGFNRKIQGTAGDVMKYAMLAVAEDKIIQDNGGEMLITLHDQLVVEFPFPNGVRDDKHCLRMVRQVKYAMEEPGRLIGIPLPVSPNLVFEHWAAPTEVKI